MHTFHLFVKLRAKTCGICRMIDIKKNSRRTGRMNKKEVGKKEKNAKGKT